MSPFWITIAVLALAGLGYLLGRNRAVRLVGGNTQVLHSRPVYHGWNVALFTAEAERLKGGDLKAEPDERR